MGYYSDLAIEIDEAVERAIEEKRERERNMDMETRVAAVLGDEGDEGLSRVDVIYLLCDPEAEYCECEGTGWIPMNNEEDARCLYHDPIEEEK